MNAPTLFGFPVEFCHAMRGFVPVCDAIERAAWWLDPEHQPGGFVGETEATAALGIIEPLDELLAERGPRGDGARFALASIGAEKLIELKARAEEIVGRAAWERAEGNAMSGAAVEQVEA